MIKHITNVKERSIMREATLIVIRKPHQGDNVIDNLVYFGGAKPYGDFRTDIE